MCPIFGVFVWPFRTRKGRGFSKRKKPVYLPVYQWSTWHLALILFLCLAQLCLSSSQCWTSRLSVMLLKKCEWGIGGGAPSQQCSVEIPFLVYVARAEFTGPCMIGCFHQGGCNYATPGLVTDELCTWASLGLRGLYYSMIFPLEVWKLKHTPHVQVPDG